MANSSFKKETTSPEKQQTLQTSNAITLGVGVGGSTTTPTPTPQQRKTGNVASGESSVTPPPAKSANGWSYVIPLPAKRVVPTQVARGSSSAPPPQRRTANSGRSTRARANVARASVAQMIGNCGGIASAIEQGNAAAGKLKKRRKPAQMVVPEGVIPTCCVCFHSFKSWKALFGHMRCHPDRQWRGCFPPPIEEQLDAALNAANPQGVAQGGDQDPILGNIDLNVPLLEEEEDDDDDDYNDGDFDLNLPPNDSTGGGPN